MGYTCKTSLSKPHRRAAGVSSRNRSLRSLCTRKEACKPRSEKSRGKQNGKFRSSLFKGLQSPEAEPLAAGRGRYFLTGAALLSGHAVFQQVQNTAQLYTQAAKSLLLRGIALSKKTVKKLKFLLTNA